MKVQYTSKQTEVVQKKLVYQHLLADDMKFKSILRVTRNKLSS